jgi:soluble epoxide hydrolase / lipid-phosphate phosphatase
MTFTELSTRFSVPFSPPTKQYIPLEDVVKKVPNYAYQLYFADPESTQEIEANVSAVYWVAYALTC